MDLSIITIVIAVAAIISPVIVAVINNRYSLKMRSLEIGKELSQRQLDVYYADKNRVHNEFVVEAGKFNLWRETPEIYIAFSSSANKVLLICEKENQKPLLDFIEYADATYGDPYAEARRKEYIEKLSALVLKLSAELMNYKVK